MKKSFAILLAILLFAVCTAAPVCAVGEEMTAKKASPVIDGEIDEVWAQADRQLLSHLKAGDLKDAGAPDDSYAYASALWDDQYLYFLFEVTDNDISVAYGGDPTAQEWRNDTIFLYIDEEWTMSPTLWVDGTYQIAFSVDGSAVLPRNGSAITGEVLHAVKEIDTGWTLEVAFPPEIISLKAGLEIGVDYQYNDGNDVGAREYCFGWSDETDNATSSAAIWGVLTLSADEVAVAAAPVVDDTPLPVEKGGVEEVPAAEPAPVEAVPALTSAPQTADASPLLLVAAAVSALGFAVFGKKRA